MLNQKDIDVLKLFYPDVDWDKSKWTFTYYAITERDSGRPEDLCSQIGIALAHSDGGCLFELGFEWVLLNQVYEPRLTCFSDAMPAVLTPTLLDVIHKLCAWKDQGFSPETLTRVLTEAGFLDRSPDTSGKPLQPKGGQS